jgi:hypothetical protein
MKAPRKPHSVCLTRESCHGARIEWLHFFDAKKRHAGTNTGDALLRSVRGGAVGYS